MRRVLLTVALVSLLAGCGSRALVPSAERLDWAPAPAATNPESVAILADAPAKFVALGYVTVDLKGIRRAVEVQRDPAIAQALRNEAASIGADAIIDVQFVGERKGPNKLYSPQVSRVIGTAIRTNG